MFKENKNGQLVYWHNGKIRGFLSPLENGAYSYSFGKPSQAEYISFKCKDLETAKRFFLDIVRLWV